MLKKLIRAVTLCVFIGSFLSTGAARASDYLAEHVPNSALVGEARLTKWFWDIYDARLYAPEGRWAPDKPFALSISYLREVSGKKIADSSAEEIRKLGFKDEVQLAIWHSQMRKIFPDVNKDTVLTGVLTEDGTSLFFKNREYVGSIKDKDFGKYFFDIWLSRKTSEPAMRRKLLGES